MFLILLDSKRGEREGKNLLKFLIKQLKALFFEFQEGGENFFLLIIINNNKL